MDYFDSIKLRALASVMDPESDDVMDDIFEWYSEKFHTPLQDVMHNIPVDDVLYRYYRFIYKQLENEDKHNHAIWLLETPAEREERKSKDRKEEDEFYQKAAEANDKKKPKKKSKAELLFEKIKNKALEESDGLRPPVVQPVRKLRDKPLAETELPGGDPEPGEEVTINYMSPEDFERELDKPLLPSKRKPKK